MLLPPFDEMLSLVREIHDAVLEPHHLKGEAPDKSLEGALSRPYNRVAYGLFGDTFDVAAMFCEVIARGHVFNDGNKRTAFVVMAHFMELNGVSIEFPPGRTEDMIVALARGTIDAHEIAWFMRNLVMTMDEALDNLATSRRARASADDGQSPISVDLKDL